MSASRKNPLNSRMADGVRRIGFRKWYERELLSSHAHMLLAFLSVIALLASMEAFRGAPISEKPMNVLFVIVCGVVCLWALRRYLFLLMRAENIANQAYCPSCSAYGRFNVGTENRGREETEVCCRQCAHRWIISATD